MQLPSYLADKFDAFDDLAESKNSILSVISLETVDLPWVLFNGQIWLSANMNGFDGFWTAYLADKFD